MALKVFYGFAEGVEIAPDGCYALILEEDEKKLLHFKPPNERVLICHPRDEAAIKKALLKLIYLPISYSGTNAAFALVHELYQELSTVTSAYKYMGEDLLSNFLGTDAFVQKALDGMALEGKFKGVPACICGAGPSLERKKDQIGGLIMAGGSALPAMKKLGITPHFGGVIDPHPPEERMLDAMGGEYPLFFRRHTHPEFLKHHKGDFLCLPGNEGALFEKDALDGGLTVTTLLAKMAVLMGCDPIVFVGVDLAQKGDASYACGMERTEGGELLPIEGTDLFTRNDWLLSAQWLTRLIHDHSEVKWINLSEGIPLEGAPMEEPQWSDVSVNLDLPPFEWRGIDVGELKESMSRVRELSREVVQALEKHFPRPPDTCGELALLTSQIEDELAHGQFFDPIWQVWQHVFAREVPDGLPPGYGVEMYKWLMLAK